MKDRAIRVTMPDGSKWDVPADIVAERAANELCEVACKNTFLAHQATCETHRRTVAFLLSPKGSGNLLASASAFVRWEEIQRFAQCVEQPRTDGLGWFEIEVVRAWRDGPREVVDVEPNHFAAWPSPPTHDDVNGNASLDQQLHKLADAIDDVNHEITKTLEILRLHNQSREKTPTEEGSPCAMAGNAGRSLAVDSSGGGAPPLYDVDNGSRGADEVKHG